MEDSGATAAIDVQAAFEQHVLPEIDVLYRVARSITRNPTDAEDLVQDTLLRAFRAIDRFDGRHPRAWLLTIMRNAQVNRVRRRRPGLLDDPDAVERTAGAAAEQAPGPEERALAGHFDAVVEDAFAALPDTFREVIELVDLGGLSYEEAATSLGIPQGTVMSRLHRGRTRIRQALKDAGIQRGATA